jgi:hypothetical protein
MSKLIYSNKFSPAFADKVIAMARDLETDPNYIIACMHFETGGTFSPSIRNWAGSGATGLIQFMPLTAVSLGTTVKALASMTAEEQLKWVGLYLHPYRGKLKDKMDVYMSILYPKAVGKPADYVLFRSNNGKNKAYFQNRGLDINKDGAITKAEAAAKVVAIYNRGIKELNS